MDMETRLGGKKKGVRYWPLVQGTCDYLSFLVLLGAMIFLVSPPHLPKDHATRPSIHAIKGGLSASTIRWLFQPLYYSCLSQHLTCGSQS